MLEAQLYNNVGLAGQYAAQNDVAIENYQKSIEIKEQLGDVIGLTKSYINLGMIYSKMEAFDQTLEYYHRALTMARRTGAQENAASVLLSMGTLYLRQKDYDWATEHYLASLEISDRIGDEIGKVASYIGLVDANLAKGNLESATQYAMKGLETAQKVDVPQAIAGIYNSAGLVEKHKAHWNKAIEHFQEAAKIAGNAGAKQQLAYAHRHHGEVYLEIQNFKNARELLQKALELFEQLQMRSEVEQIQEFMQRCEE